MIFSTKKHPYETAHMRSVETYFSIIFGEIIPERYVTGTTTSSIKRKHLKGYVNFKYLQQLISNLISVFSQFLYFNLLFNNSNKFKVFVIWALTEFLKKKKKKSIKSQGFRWPLKTEVSRLLHLTF